LTSEGIRRRLTAILAADIAGYSRLMGLDEARTVRDLKAHQAVLLPTVSEFGGRLIDTAGDGILAEFASAVQAVECAVTIQKTLAERNAALDQARRMHLRIGVNIGDVIYDETRIYGDGINVAARLEGIAEPGGICVSEDAYRQTRGKVDAEFTDLGEQSLKNIARPVRAYKVVLDGLSTTLTPELPLPSKPSIAVLPFQNMSGDPEQEYFADGMVEEIVTALSRIPWLFVIARNSSFIYKGRAVNVKQVGRELGVMYVLEGSVRTAGNRIRITAQLIDAISDAHLWSDRFDGSLEDIFELQEEVAVSVAGVIEPTVQVAEIRRSSGRPTSDLTAYDLYLRALPHGRSYEKDRIVQALDLLNQAVERDPRYGPALALSAWCRIQLDVAGWTNSRDTNRRQAVDLARQALRIGGDDPDVLARAAHALAYFGEDITAAIGLIDRSLELNPSSAHGWRWSGWIRLYAGQADLAIEHFQRAVRLSPRDRTAGRLTGIGIAHFFSRRFDEAAATLLVSLEELPAHATPYRFLASCYAHMGRLDEAREIVRRLSVVTPVVVPSTNPFRNAKQSELFLSGLRLAFGDDEMR
jgi:adenylate cyclase